MGSIFSTFAEWLGGIFSAFWEGVISLFRWICVLLWNLWIEFAGFVFDCLVSLVIFTIGYFPSLDLSKIDEGLTMIITYWQGFDAYLPLTEILVCLDFICTFNCVLTPVRFAFRFIPRFGS